MGSIRVIAEVMPLVKENLGVKADIIRLCFVASWLRGFVASWLRGFV